MSGNKDCHEWNQVLNCQNCYQCLKSHKPLFVCVFIIVFVFVFVSFFGHVMSPNHSDQMSQRSQVSGIALWMVVLFDFVLSLFMSPNHHMINCVKSHKATELLFEGVLYLAFVFYLLLMQTTLIKCLENHNSIESLSCFFGGKHFSLCKWGSIVTDKVTYWAVFVS